MDAEFCIRNYIYRTVQLNGNETFVNLMIYKLIEMAGAYKIYTTANGSLSFCVLILPELMKSLDIKRANRFS